MEKLKVMKQSSPATRRSQLTFALYTEGIKGDYTSETTYSQAISQALSHIALNNGKRLTQSIRLIRDLNLPKSSILRGEFGKAPSPKSPKGTLDIKVRFNVTYGELLKVLTFTPDKFNAWRDKSEKDSAWNTGVFKVTQGKLESKREGGLKPTGKPLAKLDFSHVPSQRVKAEVKTPEVKAEVKPA